MEKEVATIKSMSEGSMPTRSKTATNRINAKAQQLRETFENQRRCHDTMADITQQALLYHKLESEWVPQTVRLWYNQYLKLGKFLPDSRGSIKSIH